MSPLTYYPGVILPARSVFPFEGDESMHVSPAEYKGPALKLPIPATSPISCAPHPFPADVIGEPDIDQPEDAEALRDSLDSVYQTSA